MDRYIIGLDLDFSLWMGMTVADFHCRGKTAFEKQNSSRSLKGTYALHSLSTLIGISSGLVALSRLRFLRILLTSLNLRVILSIVCCVLL